MSRAGNSDVTGGIPGQRAPIILLAMYDGFTAGGRLAPQAVVEIAPAVEVLRPLVPEVLRQLQSLRLVVRADALAVERRGALQHPLIDQPAHDLPVLQD